MLPLCSYAFGSYYAQNYAGRIRQGLTPGLDTVTARHGHHHRDHTVNWRGGKGRTQGQQLHVLSCDCTTEHSHYTAETLRQAVEDHLLENPYEDVDHEHNCKGVSTALTAISKLFSATCSLLLWEKTILYQ